MGLADASGRLVLDGTEITHLPPERRYRLGVRYVPQGRRLFARLSVEENLRLGALGDYRESLTRAFEWFPSLADRRSQMAGSLSGGEQQVLALARVIACPGVLYLLDEPTDGLMPTAVERLQELIQTMRESGAGVLLIEQNVRFALAVSQRTMVLERGKITYSGLAREFATDEATLRELLGVFPKHSSIEASLTNLRT